MKKYEKEEKSIIKKPNSYSSSSEVRSVSAPFSICPPPRSVPFLDVVGKDTSPSSPSGGRLLYIASHTDIDPILINNWSGPEVGVPDPDTGCIPVIGTETYPLLASELTSVLSPGVRHNIFPSLSASSLGGVTNWGNITTPDHRAAVFQLVDNNPRGFVLSISASVCFSSTPPSEQDGGIIPDIYAEIIPALCRPSNYLNLDLRNASAWTYLISPFQRIVIEKSVTQLTAKTQTLCWSLPSSVEGEETSNNTGLLVTWFILVRGAPRNWITNNLDLTIFGNVFG